MKSVTFNARRFSIERLRKGRLRALRQDMEAVGADAICIQDMTRTQEGKRVIKMPGYAAAFGVRRAVAARRRPRRFTEAREAREYASLVKQGAETTEKVNQRKRHRREVRNLCVISSCVPPGPNPFRLPITERRGKAFADLAQTPAANTRMRNTLAALGYLYADANQTEPGYGKLIDELAELIVSHSCERTSSTTKTTSPIKKSQ